MKHLLNNMSEQEKNAIREQHTGGMQLSNDKFRKLVKSKLGDVKTLVSENNKGFGDIRETKLEAKENFWDLNFGKPTVGDAAKTHLKKHGYSHIGKDDERGGDNYVMFNGQKFFPHEIEYAGYQDLGDLPRVEDGKLIIANPAWGL